MILLTKMPESGKVKSRLAQEIGTEQAAFVYEKLLRHTLMQMRRVEVESAIALEGSAKLFQASFGNWVTWKQEGSDLGERMKNAFQKAFFLKDYRRVVLIGGDCPEIAAELMEEAFEKLEHCDLVIGPSLDGGYYLIGMCRPLPQLFEQMQWSHQDVFAETVRRANALNLRVTVLRQCRDIDDLDDLNAFPSFAP